MSRQQEGGDGRSAVRIPLFPREDMSDAQRAVYQAIVNGPRGKVVGPLRAALHAPELADRWQKLGELLRYRTSLPPRLSELAILVVARHWDSQFEWYAHAPIAEKVGLPAGMIEAIRTGALAATPHPADQVVLAYSAELLREHSVRDATYAAARELLGDTGIVELTALVGYYSMVALTLNAHEIPLPPGTQPPLPPRRAATDK